MGKAIAIPMPILGRANPMPKFSVKNFDTFFSLLLVYHKKSFLQVLTKKNIHDILATLKFVYRNGSITEAELKCNSKKIFLSVHFFVVIYYQCGNIS